LIKNYLDNRKLLKAKDSKRKFCKTTIAAICLWPFLFHY